MTDPHLRSSEKTAVAKSGTGTWGRVFGDVGRGDVWGRNIRDAWGREIGDAGT